MSGFRVQAGPYAPTPRRPRVKDAGHLDLIRALPCLVCGSMPVEAAHIRSSSRKYGKRYTGTAEKSSDKWTLPLCPKCHRWQHTMGEMFFWHGNEIDPFAAALALWAADGDEQVMLSIVHSVREERL